MSIVTIYYYRKLHIFFQLRLRAFVKKNVRFVQFFREIHNFIDFYPRAWYNLLKDGMYIIGGSMNWAHIANYKFSIGKLNCSVEIGATLSAYFVDDVKLPIEQTVLHYHPMHELFFVFDDPLMITDSSGTHEFTNCIVSIPPFIKHYSHRGSDYTLIFSFTPQNDRDDDFVRFFKNKFSAEGVSSIAVTTPAMKMYLEELAHLFYYMDNELKNELIVSLLKLIISHIYTDSIPSTDRSDTAGESNYLIISRLIAESILPQNSISLSYVAQHLHLSEKQTSRIINRYFNKSLPQLVLEAKLDYASFLLSTTQIPISQVARKANFQSENYFFSRFKEQFGCTPLQYRKKHTENE